MEFSKPRENPVNPKETSFLWGAATSSHQIEGYNQFNDWWAWEAEGNVEGGHRSGAATDHWHRFAEDLDLAKSLGLNSYRFSVEWSRIEPEEGRFDSVALDWYENLVHECEKRGLMPMLTLHHFTTPLWLAHRGGWTCEQAPEFFLRFVLRVIEKLGARVPLWCTLNEPMVLTLGSYLGKFMPPAVHDPRLASISSRTLLRAHVLAYEAIHRRTPKRAGPWKDRALEVGIAHNVMDFLPDRPWHPLERILSWKIGRFYNHSWPRAVTGQRPGFGVPFLIPEPPLLEAAYGRRTADFIGVNYYTKAYLKWRPRDMGEGASSDLPIGFSFSRRREEASDLGWAVWPNGLSKLLKQMSRYGLPLYVTENGIADHDDHLRPEYLRSHLYRVAQAIQKGIDIRGYYYWSLMDNFEWMKGFKPRFGLFKVNYESFDRTPTQTAQVLKKTIENHRGGIPQTALLTKS